MRIACFGSGQGSSGDPMYDLMEEVGYLLAQAGHIVETGGFGGPGMEAPACGARRGGGTCVGYVLAGKPANEFVTQVVDCTREDLSVERQFGDRVGRLLECDGFIIGSGGGAGTLFELMGVVNLGSKLWTKNPKRVAILNPHPASTAGWNGAMLDTLALWGTLPSTVRPLCSVVSTPADAVEWVCGPFAMTVTDDAPESPRF